MKSHGKQSFQIEPQIGYNPLQKKISVEVFTSGADIFFEVGECRGYDTNSTPFATVLLKNGYQEMLMRDITTLEARREEARQIVHYGDALANAMSKYKIPGEIESQLRMLEEVQGRLAEELKKLEAAKTTTRIARK